MRCHISAQKSDSLRNAEFRLAFLSSLCPRGSADLSEGRRRIRGSCCLEGAIEGTRGLKLDGRSGTSLGSTEERDLRLC
jgi:hypothetical protein